MEIYLLSTETLNLNAVAEDFEISRPAISKHIKFLTECGLITIRQEGRERFCEANLNSPNEVANWVHQYRVFWNKKLDDLDQHLKNKQLPIYNTKSSILNIQY